MNALRESSSFRDFDGLIFSSKMIVHPWESLWPVVHDRPTQIDEGEINLRGKNATEVRDDSCVSKYLITQSAAEAD